MGTTIIATGRSKAIGVTKPLRLLRASSYAAVKDGRDGDGVGLQCQGQLVMGPTPAAAPRSSGNLTGATSVSAAPQRCGVIRMMAQSGVLEQH